MPWLMHNRAGKLGHRGTSDLNLEKKVFERSKTLSGTPISNAKNDRLTIGGAVIRAIQLICPI